MFHPQTLFLQHVEGGSPTPTPALSELMQKMGLPICATFSEAAATINTAGWSRLPGMPSDVKAVLQERAFDISDPLGTLLLLMPHTMPPSLCLEATHAVIPGAGYQQMKKRIAAGMDAVTRNCFPKLATISGLAAVSRKPVTGEVDDISLTGGLKFDECVEQAGSEFLVREGVVLERLLELALSKMSRQTEYKRQVITTDSVPPEALAGRPTNLSTLFAWQHRMATSGSLPEKCVIWSVCPYGLRFWIEAVLHVPQVQWGLCQAFDPDWKVAGALSEVGKIVHTINAKLAQ